ncbi:MAG: coniferyl aldehyde dehydrogenase [Xanthomonadales bacterium]|nr:coniferyl aldehyde dehydrogenase [Xanthomonadales bacterium]
MADTPQPSMYSALERQRAAHLQAPFDYAERVRLLKALRAAVRSRKEAFAAAISADFGRRSRHETMIAEVMMILGDIDHHLRFLRRWMRPRPVPADALFQPGRCEIRPQALGVIGVISPWNYPAQLALMPITAALAAGNRVMLKPSELTPRTSELLAELIQSCFQPTEVECVLGGAEVAAAFSALPFDHLVFTGSTAVGRVVMQAAARNLTPVTLELGGKSPALVAENFPMAEAVDRLVAGKFMNAGQTCIAPDYVLVPQAQRESFVRTMMAEIERRYPSLMQSPDYTTIVSDRHYQRLQTLVEEAEQGGARVFRANPAGEPIPAESRVFPPTLLLDTPADCGLMREEIFGPVLPVLGYTSLEGAIAHINGQDRPLALYLFDRDPARAEKVLGATISGGVSINDTLFHIAQSGLPFGGVGPSGIGHYHGPYGFDALSKLKPVFKQARWHSMGLLNPPYRRLADFLAGFLTR